MGIPPNGAFVGQRSQTGEGRGNGGAQAGRARLMSRASVYKNSRWEETGAVGNLRGLPERGYVRGNRCPSALAIRCGGSCTNPGSCPRPSARLFPCRLPGPHPTPLQPSESDLSSGLSALSSRQLLCYHARRLDSVAAGNILLFDFLAFYQRQTRSPRYCPPGSLPGPPPGSSARPRQEEPEIGRAHV